MTTLPDKYKDENACIDDLVTALNWPSERADRVNERAMEMVESLRQNPPKSGSVEAFLQTYPLDSEEGLALMTLAEAFLRIPDTATRNALVRDRLNAADWNKRGEDWLSRLTGFGLVAGKGSLNSWVGRLSEPFVRRGVSHAMKVMGQQFVLGESIREGVDNATKNPHFAYSYDMLGEGARTFDDAEKYYQNYIEAIEYIGAHLPESKPAGISVKLSALHPRFEYARSEECVPALAEKLRHLCKLAAQHNVALTVDAEEADRLDMTLEIFEKVLRQNPAGYERFGIAVQAYQKRAFAVIEHLEMLAQQAGRRISVRLVKGAYWDSEIKHAQTLGLPGFTVFTRKCNTDVSYLACAQKLLKARDHLYPMFGTHNAHTVSAVLDMAEESAGGFEFQKLHGMGDSLYKQVQQNHDVLITVYAPVGSHKDLLPYLVRRLLENGANSSFVNKLYDPTMRLDILVRDPVAVALYHQDKAHPSIDPPYKILAPRENSSGIDLTIPENVTRLTDYINSFREAHWPPIPVTTKDDIRRIVRKAVTAQTTWRATAGEKRARILEKIATQYEKNREYLIAILVQEGGKTIPDALAEVREAVDFCRYYAARGRSDFVPGGHILPGPTGEDNRLYYEGRGTFVCISPWNFPLAIFTGQVVAALMAGNSVLAKPAEQTPHIALKAIEMMYQAGVPKEVLHLIQGDGQIGAALVEHPEIAGVAFTGSAETARAINRALAAKDGKIPQLIAETGGQNAMIVDSSALPEQVIDDVIHSAFGSAGQRCSALRVLYVPEEVADQYLTMLRGAMETMKIGDPAQISTDVGPVIDGDAYEMLTRHKSFLDANGEKIAEAPTPQHKDKERFYVAPVAYEIDSLDILKGEVFGPVLHVVRYKPDNLESVIAEINATGYGLTFGMHSRVAELRNRVAKQVRAGNVYINRGMTGAVVGSQPFGGHGLSGAGPKAGGPNYLRTFAHERVISEDTTASGGNASLVTIVE